MDTVGYNGKYYALTELDAAVIGSGAAAWRAAGKLKSLGLGRVGVITEGREFGTSRNAGSDKQTYYKLSLCGDAPDSVRQMARDLFQGGCVHGDTALAEAAGSVQEFMHLAELGIPFPVNEYGEFVGYKTDHDPRQRATSAGPLTSKLMTEALEAEALSAGAEIFDGRMAFALLTDEAGVCGVLALETETGRPMVFASKYVVLATGGPAGVYGRTVYPESQTGMTGMALEAGAACVNLQHWQYGLASVGFRWNVSGTYQQVLPKYVAVTPEGEEYELLSRYFDDPARALDMVFLKGYQWPFDIRKLDGSSVIDLIVHYETGTLGNRVFMDFRENPSGLENGFGALSRETREYLENSGAVQATPIERLMHMNPKAAELYASHGIDLRRDMLEVAVCAQHCNGGIAVDAGWRTDVPGLYAVGEAAGTFGVYRPGGSALNSGQVGAARAAGDIARRFEAGAADMERVAGCMERHRETLEAIENAGSGRPSGRMGNERQRFCDMYAACVRSPEKLEKAAAEFAECAAGFWKSAAPTAETLTALIKERDACITAAAVLSAMALAAEAAGSQGSGLVLAEDGRRFRAGPVRYTYAPEKEESRGGVVETGLERGRPVSREAPVRPLPDADTWFERVWSSYEKRRGLTGSR